MHMTTFNPKIVYSLLTASLCSSGTAAAANDVFPVPGAPEANLAWQTVQVVLALAVTLVLLVATVWALKRILGMKRFPGVSGGAIRILEIHHLDPRKAIALIKILDRGLIVGYADSSISILGELTAEEIVRLEESGRMESAPFGNILARFIKTAPRDGNE